jgi:hypothetical protein
VIEARRTTASSSGMTDTIKIDFAAIPDYVREELAEATLESVRAFIRQPGGREFLDARKAAKKAATSKAAK